MRRHKGIGATMRQMYFDKICTTCHSLFDSEAIRRLQKRSSRPLDRKRAPHFSYHELVQSAEYCHLCEWITGSVDTPPATIDGRIDETAVLNKNISLSIEISKILYGVMGLEIYGENQYGSEILVGTVLLSPVSTQKYDNIIARRLTSQRELNERTVSQIQQWIADCTSSHHSCNIISKLTTQTANWPIRLLEILEPGQKLRVRPTEMIASDVRYATLSHCWGDFVDCRLLEENVNIYCQSVPFDKLPQTFKECIEVVSRLGFRYLWIDAMCIIQDSKNDWLAESSKMGEIYSRSILNIAATASKNGREGLFHPPSSLTPCILKFPKEDGAYPNTFVTHDELHYFDRIENSPLNQRGWVLQERILSAKTIHFALGEVFWECHSLVTSETLPDSAFLGTEKYKGMITPTPSRQDEILKRWNSIVTQYMQRKLTMGSDKLPAISGLARRAARYSLLGWNDYLAGLWRVTLAKDLIWVTLNQSSRVVPGRSPSWSWARIDGEIHLAKNLTCQQIRILDAKVERMTDPFGSVGPGFITLQGPVCSLALTGIKRPPTFDELVSPDGILVKNNKATLSASSVDWDDWSNQEINMESLYLLICDIDSETFYTPHCKALVLQATGEEKGQFERLGGIFQCIDCVDDLLSLSKNSEVLDSRAHTGFDPCFGFTITIH